MPLLGLRLRKPGFAEVTAAAVMAVGVWLALCGAAQAAGWPLQRDDAGALLVVVGWGCIGARLGLRLDAGCRAALAHLAVGATLLGAYQAALAI